MAEFRLGRRTVAFFSFAIFAVIWTVPSMVASDGVMHSAPIVLLGPSEVVGPLTDQINALDGTPIDATGTESSSQAEELLASGDVVAVVKLRLAKTEDVVRLTTAHTPRLKTTLIDLITQFEATHGRTIKIDESVDPMRGPPLPVTTGIAAGIGWALVLLVSLVWGPVARSLRRGTARFLALFTVGTITGTATAVLTVRDPSMNFDLALTVGGVTLLGILASGTFTLACEALAGLRGLLLGATGVGVLAFPLMLVGDPWLLAQPWAAASNWTIPGAMTSAITTIGFQDPAQWLQPAVVLVGTTVLALAVMIIARVFSRQESSLPPASVAATRRIAYWRAQLAGTAVLVMASAVLVVTVWSAVADDDPRPPLASLASVTTCVQSGPVQSVDDLNRIANLRGSGVMRGGDVGASATLADDRSVWMFGDTIRDASTVGDQIVRNSMLLVEPGYLRMVMPSDTGAIIPNRADGVGYWPMSVVVSSRPGYDLILVTMQRVRTTDPDDAFGFESLGPAIATFVVPTGGIPQLISVIDIGEDSTDATRPMWGAATARQGGWLYLYGTARSQQAELGAGFSVRVARVHPADVAKRSDWTFWDGSGWVSEESAATELVDEVNGTSQTLSAFERDGRWYLFSKRNEFLGSELVFWTASQPQGPFTAQPPVGTLPSDASSGVLRYMPLAHPDLLPEPGSMVISYSQNTTDLGAVLENPLLYRPQFMRVPLPY